MPQLETVHVKTTLTNVAIAYFQEPGIFIADQLSPHVRSSKPADYYFIYGKEHFNVVNAIRRPGTTPVEVEHTVSTDQYVCQEYSLREKVTDEEKEAADNPIEPEADTTRYVSERLRLSREKRVADEVTDNGNYQVGFYETLDAEAQWNAYETSSPIEKIQYAMDAVAAQGRQPNTMWMGYEVWSKLRHHPDFLSRLPSNTTQIVTTALLKLLWEEIEEVAIGSALYNTAAEGQDEDLGYVWGKYFGVAYINRAMPNKKQPSFNYTFVWPYSVRGGRIRRDNQPGAANGTVYQARTYRHADEGARSDWAEVAMREGFKITGPHMAYLIEEAVA